MKKDFSFDSQTEYYKLFLSEDGSIQFKMYDPSYRTSEIYGNYFDFQVSSESLGKQSLLSYSAYHVADATEISSFVMYNNSIGRIVSFISKFTLFFEGKDIDTGEYFYAYISNCNIRKIKFFKETNMLHTTFESLQANQRSTKIKKEKILRTSVNLFSSLLLSIFSILSYKGIICTFFTFLPLICFLIFIVATHLCECLYSKNLRIEISSSILNFLLFNISTILIGGVLALVNTFLPILSWSDIFRFTIVIPTVVSVVVSILPVLYMVLKHGLVILIRKICNFTDFITKV